ncbi:MAG: polysaccharide deacetylase family protein [Oscillospiraceae bacterium]|nr:polysaccharide deacetylase family protein [Oscillospiraceae bacterium]
MKKRAVLLCFAVVIAILCSARAAADIAPEPEEYSPAEKYLPRQETSKPMVALTFDDGPSGQYTLQILDILRQYDAKATFFLSGYRLTENQYAVAREILNEGCEIGNHTYSHTDLTTLTPEEIQWEIDSTNDLIFAATGTTANLLRPPYGEFDENVLSAGYPVVTWCIDTLDWMHMDPQKSLQAVQENAFDGCIILMHDMFETSAQGCRLIVPWLIGEGYELVTVSELFAAKGQTLSSGSTHRWAG